MKTTGADWVHPRYFLMSAMNGRPTFALALTVGQGPPYRRIATIIGCASAHRFGLVIRVNLLCTGGKTGDPTPPTERAPDFDFNGGPRPTLQTDGDNHRVRLGAPLRPCHPHGLALHRRENGRPTRLPTERASDVGFNGGPRPTLQTDCDNHRVHLGAPLQPCHPREDCFAPAGKRATLPRLPTERASDAGFNGGPRPTLQADGDNHRVRPGAPFAILASGDNFRGLSLNLCYIRHTALRGTSSHLHRRPP